MLNCSWGSFRPRVKWLLLCLLLLAHGAGASELVGRVVSVHDGDTLTVLASGKQIKVRLSEIDAPELRQPFGQRSRQALANICFRREASVVESGKDRYGRAVGHVICDGVDANTEQVRRGMAWVYVRYAPKNSPVYPIQAEARSQRTGLWEDPRPVPPWEWRQAGRRPR